MLQASEKVAARQFAEATALYGAIIAANSTHIDAYLQRAMVAREMGHSAQQQSDALTVIKLADATLANTALPTKKAARYYHLRGSGYRLLNRFKEARADIEQALRLKNETSWRMDLQSIALEERMTPR